MPVLEHTDGQGHAQNRAEKHKHDDAQGDATENGRQVAAEVLDALPAPLAVDSHAVYNGSAHALIADAGGNGSEDPEHPVPKNVLGEAEQAQLQWHRYTHRP